MQEYFEHAAGAFNPDELRILCQAFERLVQDLGVQGDQERAQLAARLINKAQVGSSLTVQDLVSGLRK